MNNENLPTKPSSSRVAGRQNMRDAPRMWGKFEAERAMVRRQEVFVVLVGAEFRIRSRGGGGACVQVEAVNGAYGSNTEKASHFIDRASI